MVKKPSKQTKSLKTVKNKKDLFKDKSSKEKSSGFLLVAIIAIGVLAIGAFIFFKQGRPNPAVALGLEIAKRYLPEDYQEAVVSDPVNYKDIGKHEMIEIKGQKNGKYFEFDLQEVLDNKFVLLKYEDKQVAQSSEGPTGLPIMAYIKPSGKLFVGVSFCPPCGGLRHTITPEGTLYCNVCGTTRDLETDKGLSGACKLYPSDQIPATVEDGKVKIATDVLDNWEPQVVDQATRPVGG